MEFIKKMYKNKKIILEIGKKNELKEKLMQKILNYKYQKLTLFHKHKSERLVFNYFHIVWNYGVQQGHPCQQDFIS